MGLLRREARAFRRFAGLEDAGDLEAIEAFMPWPRFVWIRRADVVAQAVSWSRAIQGGNWWSGETRPERQLRFDFDEIDGLVRVIGEHDEGWRAWFERNGWSRTRSATRSWLPIRSALRRVSLRLAIASAAVLALGAGSGGARPVTESTEDGAFLARTGPWPSG